MPKIKLIDGYQKIAAGEVIERPSSVVKELIENSLDAKATKIIINIKNAGKDLIHIIDDGNGVEAEEVEIAFLRHTSSKISSADELDQLNTLGFRGEALASIATVSKIIIQTRTISQDFGIELHLNEGKKIKREECGTPVGFSIKIQNIFFNLPVRRKFLKSNKIEFGHISDIFCRYALGYPQVHFKLIHNDIVRYNSPSWVGTKLNNSEHLPIEAYGYSIQSIYGKKTYDNMIPISFTDEKFKLFGYIGYPEISRSDHQFSSLFINDRFVSHKKIEALMDRAYQDFLMRRKHPFYELFLYISPDQVDFNIHPSKKKVKFLEEEVFLSNLEQILTKLIKESLIEDRKSKNQANESKFQQKITTSNNSLNLSKIRPSSILNIKETKEGVHSNIKNKAKSQNRKSDSGHLKIIPENSKERIKVQTHFQKNKITVNNTKIQGTSRKKITPLNKLTESISSKNVTEDMIDSSIITVKQLPYLQLLNNGIQAGKNYLLFQNNEELVIIDQHAAAERINYEKVKKSFEEEKISIQQLLIPKKLEVAQNEIDFVKEAIPMIKKFGFELEFFGGNTFIIRTIPAILKESDGSAKIIPDICMELIHKGHSNTFANLKREMIQYIACHMSITAGDEIWNENMIRKLVKQLDALENPHHCAHGRPTYIKISYHDLDKKFHRI